MCSSVFERIFSYHNSWPELTDGSSTNHTNEIMVRQFPTYFQQTWSQTGIPAWPLRFAEHISSKHHCACFLWHTTLIQCNKIIVGKSRTIRHRILMDHAHRHRWFLTLTPCTNSRYKIPRYIGFRPRRVGLHLTIETGPSPASGHIRIYLRPLQKTINVVGNQP